MAQPKLEDKTPQKQQDNLAFSAIDHRSPTGRRVALPKSKLHQAGSDPRKCRNLDGDPQPPEQTRPMDGKETRNRQGKLAVLRFGGDQRICVLRHNATVLAPAPQCHNATTPQRHCQDCTTTNRYACICTLMQGDKGMQDALQGATPPAC